MDHMCVRLGRIIETDSGRVFTYTHHDKTIKKTKKIFYENQVTVEKFQMLEKILRSVQLKLVLNIFYFSKHV